MAGWDSLGRKVALAGVAMYMVDLLALLANCLSQGGPGHVSGFE